MGGISKKKYYIQLTLALEILGFGSSSSLLSESFFPFLFAGFDCTTDFFLLRPSSMSELLFSESMSNLVALDIDLPEVDFVTFLFVVTFLLVLEALFVPLDF